LRWIRGAGQPFRISISRRERGSRCGCSSNCRKKHRIRNSKSSSDRCTVNWNWVASRGGWCRRRSWRRWGGRGTWTRRRGPARPLCGRYPRQWNVPMMQTGLLVLAAVFRVDRGPAPTNGGRRSLCWCICASPPWADRDDRGNRPDCNCCPVECQWAESGRIDSVEVCRTFV